jgi:hypothetical protein
MPRGSLSVDKNIANEFSVQAERQGKTLYSFANEWLNAASKITAEGGAASTVLGYWRIWSVLKQVDVITLPADFVEELISKLYAADKASLLGMFSSLGENLVGLTKMAAPGVEQLSVLAKQLAEVIPTKKIEIQGSDGKSLVVNIVGAGRRMETTECSFEFVKALLNGYGYNVSSQELGVGTIRIQATRRGL